MIGVTHSPADAPATGRRERNKQAKLERIVAAAQALFDEHGIEEVTTQQIARAADVGTGTLFLYARTKAELVLLVENAHYAAALAEDGGGGGGDPLDALMSIVRSFVRCNLTHVENGRAYLREMVFGDPREPRHAEALAILTDAQASFAAVLRDRARWSDRAAAAGARTVASVMVLALANPHDRPATVDGVAADVREQLQALLS